LKQTLRVGLFLSLFGVFLAIGANSAQAQKMDVAFGVSTLDAPGISVANGDHAPVSLTGGVYPGFSGDVLFFHNLGIGGDIYWKGGRGKYGNDPTLPFRPIFFDINAVYAPKLASHTDLELVAGIGAQDTRIYCQGCGNGYNTNFAADKHFMVDFGAGLKFYPGNSGFFIRPEGRLYLVNNNLLFSSPRIVRYGLSIGYTFK
jgi:hypothetical protein